MDAFVSWSGGKESSLACYRTMQSGNLRIRYLLNMISDDAKRSHSHGLKASVLRAQSEAMGTPIMQRRATWESYEGVFKKAILELRKQGITTGIFGDIDIQEHRDWVERVCKNAGIKPLLPLWKENRQKLLEEFIDAGFRATIVATKAEFLGKEWLGLEIDRVVMRKLKALGAIDLCGEKGEYHTLVTDGPIFKKKIKLLEVKKIQTGERCLLDILKYSLVAK